MHRRGVDGLTLYTVGHSTHPIEHFLEMLRSFQISVLVDVRTVPRSGRNPQFESATLATTIQEAGMEYLHLKALGGLRKPQATSRNTIWKNDSFRGYADYMASPEWKEALSQLRQLAAERRVAIMCAESVPWRCHRNLIADAAVVLHGDQVFHIMAPGKANPHKPTSFARTDGDDVVYDGGQADLLL